MDSPDRPGATRRSLAARSIGFDLGDTVSPRRITDVATEVAVAALSLVVTFGLARFFVDLRWRADLVTIVVASHFLALVVRRAGFGMGISAVVSAAGMLVVGNIVLFPETSGSIVPTGETLDLLRSDLEAAWNAFELQQRLKLRIARHERGRAAVGRLDAHRIACCEDGSGNRAGDRRGAIEGTGGVAGGSRVDHDREAAVPRRTELPNLEFVAPS